MLNSVDLAAIISLVIFFILSLICLCWLYSYYLLRGLREISSRNPLSSIFAGCLCIFGLIVIYPFTILFQNTTFLPHSRHESGTNTILLFINMGLYHVLTFRAYILYFNIKWIKALDDQQWRLYIDPDEKNWYLKYKNSWGNPKRIGLILLIHLSFWTIPSMILIYVNMKGHGIITALLAGSGLIPTITDIIVYIKFPKFQDIWGSTKEIKRTLTVELLNIIGLSILSILIQPPNLSVSSIVLSDIAAFCLFVYSFIMHYKVLKQCHLPTNPYHAKQHLLYLYNQQSMIDFPTTPTSPNDVQTNNITLRDVLNNENGFNEFARHLTKEFCIENLLFLVETQQWLQSLISRSLSFVSTKSELTTPTTPRLNDESFILPSNAPKSRIVELENKEDNEYIQCVKLFKKYIANDAYFCINISGKQRNVLYEKFGYNDGEKNISDMVMAEYLKNQENMTDEVLSLN